MDRLSRIAKEASEHHMSYGKYVASMYDPRKPIQPTRRCGEPRVIICAECGKEFVRYDKVRAKYCSEYCKNRHKNRAKAEKRASE